MKIQDILRMQAVVIGLAGVLFFASSAQAQEITNTEWPDRPGATAPFQATSEQTAAAPAATDLNVAAVGSGSMTATAVIAKPTVIQEASVSPALQSWAMAALFVLFAIVVLYKRGAARQPSGI
jgi:lysylphosphatidylglycerol synthetase-like protein (DUF2156 family)